MRSHALKTFFPILLFLTLIGCAGGGDDTVGRPGGGDVRVNLSAQFQKRTLGPGGLGSPEARPARYTYCEILRESDGSVVGYGPLDANGQGHANVPAGTRLIFRVYARVDVPTLDGKNGLALRGSVKATPLQDTYPSAALFNQKADVYYQVPMGTVSSGSTVGLTVPIDASDAGAFNIADQMATFALGVLSMEPSLKLPNLHAFWTTAYDRDGTLLPRVAMDNNNRVLTWYDAIDKVDTRRAIFQMKVRRALSSAPDRGTDEYNDSLLVARFAHLLFADYSYREDGSSAWSLFRRDNDATLVDRDYQSEAAAAFVHGFSDFLSCAFRNNPVMYSVNEQGQVGTFSLTSHGQFAMDPWQGEFYRGAISVSLWNIWKSALGGTLNDLGKLWDAAFRNSGPMEYNNAVLGCYPTFLVGLKSQLGATSNAWNACLSELAKESIGDVTSTLYFNSGALWTQKYPPFSTPGAVVTYAPEKSLYYDRDQAQAYRFTHPLKGARRITLVPTGGQDLFLEIFSTTGLLDASWSAPYGATRVIDLPNLDAGDYLVRVRAGYTSADRNASYTLTVQ